MRRHILNFLSACCLVAFGASAAYAQGGDVKLTRKEATIQTKDVKLPLATGLSCVQASSTGSQSCKDSGGYDSTCATATCPAGYTLTGGGGSCSAGDRKVKSLFPRVDRGEFTIVCEQQGVPPQANAVCCKMN